MQERDLKFLNLLNRFELMTTMQIQKLVFCSIARTTMLRRLRLLSDNKYIKQGPLLDNYSRTWQLAEKSNKVLSAAGTYDFSNRNTVNHDTLVTDLRIKLESLGLGLDWVSGNEIKSKASLNLYKPRDQVCPDGLMIELLNGNSVAIAIELELTAKSLKRYKELFSSYYLNQGIGYVWYFVKDLSVLKSIFKLSHEYSIYFNKMLFSYIDDVLKNDNFNVFICAQKKWKTLSEISFNNQKKTAHNGTQGVSTLNDQNSEKEFGDKSSESLLKIENLGLGVSGDSHA